MLKLSKSPKISLQEAAFNQNTPRVLQNFGKGGRGKCTLSENSFPCGIYGIVCLVPSLCGALDVVVFLSMRVPVWCFRVCKAQCSYQCSIYRLHVPVVGPNV